MEGEKPLLLLLDGNALVHRAFHALPPLTVSRTGEMVNAVRGFAATLLKVMKEIKPTYWAIAFDRPSPTFRHEKFADYKKQRPETPRELINQIERVHQVAEAFRIPVFEIDGYEADDILGTLSSQASQKGIDTVIVTGDNDMLQVVSPDVRVLSPRRTFNDTVLYDEEGVQQKYGVGPHQLVDFKALVGDSSDNIPGIPGIGDKTAAKLLTQFGTIEQIYERMDEVTPPKLQGVLEEYKERVIRNRELAAIVTDVPVTFDTDKCEVSAYDRQQVVNLFRDLEFVQLLSRLPEEFQEQEVAPPVKTEPEGNYNLVTDSAGLEQLCNRLSKADEFAIDLETTGKDAMTADPVGISLSLKHGEAFYIPVGHQGLSLIPQLQLSEVLEKLQPLLEDRALSKIGQNGKYDMKVLALHGVMLENLAFDTMIAAHILGEKSIGLKALAFNKLGIEMTPIGELIGKGAKQVTMAQVDIEKAADYACADADMTLRLRHKLGSALREEGLWELFSEVEMPLIPVLLAMELHGVAVDIALLKEMSKTFEEDMQRLEEGIYDSVGHRFNINSSQQLSRVLYDELQLVRARKIKTGYSTDAATLEELKGSHPVIELILQYRQVTKLKSTYVDAFLNLINPKTGRIHTTFNQTGTSTGRLSSSDPNLQNVPVRGEMGAKIRQALVAEDGWSLLSADYSQIDLRVLAHLSQDAALINTFLNDEDVHTATASRVFNVHPDQVTGNMRRVAKTVNFGVVYGMSDYGLEQATDFNRQEASQFITSYFEKYPRIKEYIETTKEQASESGYVQTVLGRRRYIPEIKSPNRQIKEAAERMAVNMPVQGTSADIIKIAMVSLHREMNEKGLKSKMLLQIHDELIFEVPPDEMETMKELVNKLMPNALKLDVPLKIDIKTGKNWGDMT
jgi:DNA polymerase-1